MVDETTDVSKVLSVIMEFPSEPGPPLYHHGNRADKHTFVSGVLASFYAHTHARTPNLVSIPPPPLPTQFGISQSESVQNGFLIWWAVASAGRLVVVQLLFANIYNGLDVFMDHTGNTILQFWHIYGTQTTDIWSHSVFFTRLSVSVFFFKEDTENFLRIFSLFWCLQSQESECVTLLEWFYSESNYY